MPNPPRFPAGRSAVGLDYAPIKRVDATAKCTAGVPAETCYGEDQRSRTSVSKSPESSGVTPRSDVVWHQDSLFNGAEVRH